MQVSNFKLGADPEFTLNDGVAFISAEGMLGGTKKEPLDIGNGCSIQEDCVAVEFNIPPASTKEEFVNSIVYALTNLRDRIPSNFDFSWTPMAEFEPYFLRSKQATQSGCSVDNNVWGLKCRVPKLHRTNERQFGGHIHFGYDKANKGTSMKIIKVAEVYLTIATLDFEKPEPAIKRRRLYGGAGSFRFKNYGVEYRSLSSWWLACNDNIEYLYDLSKNVVDIVNRDDDSLIEEIDSDKDHIINAINNHDKVSVDYITNKYKTPVV
jgi:hypothetical protein